MQSLVFLFSGMLMLWLSLYLTNILLQHSRENGGEHVLIPQILGTVNMIFVVYAFYVGGARILGGKLI